MSPPSKGNEPLEHWVSDAPFDPHVADALTPEQERVYMASQWRIMWIRFQAATSWPSGPARSSAVIYFSVLISEFIAPYNMHTRHTDHIYAPPQSVNLFHDGSLKSPVHLRS
jgi:peptide/nickel transport system permease protein